MTLIGTDLTHDVQDLPDVFPVVSAGEAAVPTPLPAGAEPVPQVVIRKEDAPMVVPLADEKTLHVAMIGLIEDGSDLPADLLDSEPVYQTVVLLTLACLFRRGLRSYLQGCADVLADHFCCFSWGGGGHC